MNRSILAGNVLVGLGLLVWSAIANAEESYTTRPEIRVAEKCVPCESKCRRCLARGPGKVFKTLESCIADCRAHGDPLVVPTCGVYRACR